MLREHEVAEWMLKNLEINKTLDQEWAVYEIKKKFGSEYTYVNENGNLSIDKSVLREFRKLTEGRVVWERSDRCWRFRNQFDPPDKRMVD